MGWQGSKILSYFFTCYSPEQVKLLYAQILRYNFKMCRVSLDIWDVNYRMTSENSKKQPVIGAVMITGLGVKSLTFAV